MTTAGVRMMYRRKRGLWQNVSDGPSAVPAPDHAREVLSDVVVR